MDGPVAALLPDGQRLHLQHGPIDLICGVFGADRNACYCRAWVRFRTILDELVAELPTLRQPVQPIGVVPGDQSAGPVFVHPRHFSQKEAACHLGVRSGMVARRMRMAAGCHGADFVTPMAAVAGAVADEVLEAMVAGCDATKAYVNNGGDVAFHLTPGAAITSRGPAGPVRIAFADAVRGLATSGWRGRSHSLGIADAVTVAANTAAAADVAATLIANAVDLPGHPAIDRIPADHLSPDSDLSGCLVTRGVGTLSACDVEDALTAGEIKAQGMAARGLIRSATILLAGKVRVVTRDGILEGEQDVA